MGCSSLLILTCFYFSLKLEFSVPKRKEKSVWTSRITRSLMFRVAPHSFYCKHSDETRLGRGSLELPKGAELYGWWIWMKRIKTLETTLIICCYVYSRIKTKVCFRIFHRENHIFNAFNYRENLNSRCERNKFSPAALILLATLAYFSRYQYFSLIRALHYSFNIFQFKKKSPKSKVVAIFKTLLKSPLWATGSFKCIIHFWGTWCE